MAVIGQFEAAGMTQHVRMDREWHRRRDTEPLDQFMEADRGHGSPPLGNEHMGGVGIVAAQPSQGSDFVAPNGMDGWRAVLRPTNMQPSLIQLNLMPFQPNHLGRSQAVSV